MPCFLYSFPKHLIRVPLETAHWNCCLTQYSLFLCNWLCADSVSCGSFQASRAFLTLCPQSGLQHFSVFLNCLSHSAPTVLRNKLVFYCHLTWNPYSDFILVELLQQRWPFWNGYLQKGTSKSVSFHGTNPQKLNFSSHCIIIACKYIRTYMFYSVASKQEIKLLFKLYACSMLAVIPTV